MSFDLLVFISLCFTQFKAFELLTVISYVECFILLNFFKTFLGLGHLYYRPFIAALGKWRQEDEEHKVILGYVANLSQKNRRNGMFNVKP